VVNVGVELGLMMLLGLVLSSAEEGFVLVEVTDKITGLICKGIVHFNCFVVVKM